MRTPKEWSDNLKTGLITGEMLNAALFSVNKRAKNYRNSKRLQWGTYRDISEAKQNQMYDKKDKLLSILKPVCIHKEKLNSERIRVYDYQSKYDNLLLEKARQNKIVWMNSYLDYNDYTIVSFFDYYTDKVTYKYYLFYELGTRSYHIPITDITEYPDLEVIEISNLKTDGEDIADLVSVQFVDKILSLIESNQYTYIEPSGFTIKQEYKNIENPDYNEFSESALENLTHPFLDIIKEKVRKWILSSLSKTNIEEVVFDKEEIDILVDSNFESLSNEIFIHNGTNFVTSGKFHAFKKYDFEPKVNIDFLDVKNFLLNSDFTDLNNGADDYISKNNLYNIPEKYIQEYAKKVYYEKKASEKIISNKIIEVRKSKIRKWKKQLQQKQDFCED